MKIKTRTDRRQYRPLLGKALEALGWVRIPCSDIRYWEYVMPGNGNHVFLGREGAVRMGRSVGKTISIGNLEERSDEWYVLFGQGMEIAYDQDTVSPLGQANPAQQSCPTTGHDQASPKAPPVTVASVSSPVASQPPPQPQASPSHGTTPSEQQPATSNSSERDLAGACGTTAEQPMKWQVGLNELPDWARGQVK